jgi:4-amino-4-deoxy-L-arabinose transferase-like glycosyltransferase
MRGEKHRSLIQAQRARAKARLHMIGLIDGRFDQKRDFRDSNRLTAVGEICVSMQQQTADGFHMNALRFSQIARRLFRPELTCIMLLAVGLTLRLIAIDSRGLWSDEAWRVWAARLPSVADVLHVAWAQPPSAPLYWLALHFWIRLFGHGDVAVRMLSVIPSVANIVAIYWLGRLLSGPAAGTMAAALLTVAPLAVEIGQEATMYAWTMLAVTLALAAGWSWYQTGRGAARYLACGGLLVWLHYLGPLLLAWFFLAGLLIYRYPGPFGIQPLLTRRTWIRGHLVLTAIWLPWAVAIGVRAAERWPELSQLSHRFGWAELYAAAAHSVLSASPQSFWPPQWVAVAVTGGGSFLIWALGRTRLSPAWLCAGIGIGTLGTLAGSSTLTGMWLFQPRFLALALPLLILVLAMGMAAPVSSFKQRVVLVGLAAFWLGAQIAGLLSFYTHPVHGRDGLREIGSWLTEAVAPPDAVVGNHPLLLWCVAQYYPGPLHGLPADWDVRWGYPLLPPSQPSWVQEQQASLLGIAGAAPRLWLLYLPIVDPEGALLSSIRAQYHEVATRSYPLMTVYLFSRKPS